MLECWSRNVGNSHSLPDGTVGGGSGERGKRGAELAELWEEEVEQEKRDAQDFSGMQ